VDYVPDKRKNENRGFASDLSIGDTFGKAWQVVQRWGWHFFGLGIVYAVIQAPASCMQYMLESSATQAGGDENLFIGIVFMVYALFFVYPLSFGYYWVYLKGARNEAVGVGDLFVAFRRNYWSTVGLYFLLLLGIVALVAVALLLMVVIGMPEWAFFLTMILPTSYLWARWFFVMFLLVDVPMSPTRALRTSWQMTEGYAWKIIGVAILLYVMVVVAMLGVMFALSLFPDLVMVLGIFVMFIALIPFMMWATSIFAVFYHSVALQDGIPGVEKRKNDMEYAYS
jgi:hypothetical protein